MNDLVFQRPGPMPFRILLDEALRLARRHFRAIYPQVAIPAAVLATLLAVAQALWFSQLTSGASVFGVTPGIYLLTLAYIGLLVVAYMAMQVAVIDVLSGRPADMRRAWRFAVQGRVLGTLFLWYVATIASVVCCCLPALVVVPLLSFVSPLMVEEGRFWADSFSRSTELARYDPGQGLWERPAVKVLLFLGVGLLISYLLGLLVALPFQIPMYIDMFRKVASGEDTLQAMPRWLWLQVPAQFLNALVSTAVYLYICFGITLLFFDTRGRKEGTDLRSEIDDVFGDPPPELPFS
ncbi:MAG TPA: hypothetical protein VKK31_21185 [Thermoanaerobaculia bacterium]|nr:hypothetical protein [Thermoanaerobaculia bacterium]